MAGKMYPSPQSQGSGLNSVYKKYGGEDDSGSATRGTGGKGLYITKSLFVFQHTHIKVPLV
ncbi:hypothetical protein F3Y22_tig00117056pilonHSYRG01319 [Hibiscus syriacus]|uniref:Uncharacterized protein n=1 Tax=Hibiscus syriacus TaxID=106335 RepID=A0A6A2WLM8_HIBSY|nr:hypothetical protein F3Y22_tig00117056pilonHSYRG01319 [Hibiscus syriacus]